MRSKKTVGSVKKYQKNRVIYKAHAIPQLKIGDCGFFFIQNFRFELVYLKLLRKRIKRSVKIVKRDSFLRRAWLNLKVNYPISKKTKNARMGKGKGSFFRWAIRLKPNIMFVEFSGFPQGALRRVIKQCYYSYNIFPYIYTDQSGSSSWGRTSSIDWDFRFPYMRLQS